MFTKIVTHAGSAHRDEFISCALAISTFPTIHAIERRDPTPEELEDPNILVLDVGGKHEPEKGNFDHHQLPRDHAPECALTMFLQHIGLLSQFNLMPWVESTAVMDSKGPVALAKHLGCTTDVIFKNLSPIEGALVEKFGRCQQIMRGGFVWMILAELGQQFLAHARELQDQQDWLANNAKLIEVGGLYVMVLETDNTKGTQQFRDTKCLEVAVSISWDDRGPGWALYRFNDHPAVNFAWLEGEPAVSFAHKGGFIAKTKERVPLDEVLNLVKKSMHRK